jgi:DNA-binding NarL/FixJ family response regulator
VIRVLLADDQALLRAGLRVLLEGEPDIEVVGEAADGEEALRLARATRPDVILMDIRMPVLDGAEATRRIADERLGGVKVLILTTFESDEFCSRRCEAGRAASSSRTATRSSCSRRSAWSPRARRCSPRRPRAG